MARFPDFLRQRHIPSSDLLDEARIRIEEHDVEMLDLQQCISADSPHGIESPDSRHGYS